MANQGSCSVIFNGLTNATVVDISNQPFYMAVIHVQNNTAALAYCQIFGVAAASVVIGTTVPLVQFSVPASGGVVVPFPGEGFRIHAVATSIATTTLRTGSASAACDVMIYKKN
jgi:hypothetical protein